jgi:hypothetical protein
VVGIAQDDLGADLFNLRRSHPFDCGLGANGHENGGLNIAVASLENSTSRLTVFFEHCEHLLEVSS